MSKGTDKDAVTPAGEEPRRGGSRVDTLPEDFIRLLHPPQLKIGDVIAGRYQLVERLGDGAMGTVFVAENVAIGRRVAVKVLRHELLVDPSFRQRFQHEAEAIAAIEHRNVARFLDLVVGDPTFLVMEYVRGPTLDAVLEKDRKLPVKRATHITERLCWALEAAHAAGVIHRDIKPANVILSPELEHGEEPKLIDFGLAKLAHAAVKAGLTRTGQIVGTPEYMAPEQIANKPVDARADVYALGCLLYELLTGRPPFEGSDDVQVLYQQLHDAPQPLPSQVPEAPRELVGVVMRALAKKPEDRFQSMREMATALQAVPDGSEDWSAAHVPRTGTRPRARRRSVPRWVPPTLGALALVLGFGLGRLPHGAQKDATALLLISQPQGAAVELDGRPLGEPTPTSVRDLAPGAHAVKIKKGDKAVVERRVQLSPGERAVMNVVLPPSSHSVEVHSAPEGASVYLDNKLAVGETPTMIEVTDDDFHELRVEKTGFETTTRALTPDDQEPVLRLSLTPEKQPRGTLMVDSNGAAEVYIDGVDTGFTTPTLGIHVPVGEHVVELKDGANAHMITRVRIRQGQTARVLLTPQAGKTP